MANVNNPFGLMPRGRADGGGQPQARPYLKQSTYAYAVYKWDPLTLVTGYVKGPANGITPGTTRYRGVGLNPSAASTAATILVVDHAQALFMAQGDGSTAANVVVGKMGFNANLLLTTAGGGVTADNSGAQIDESTIAVTSTLDVNIKRLAPLPDNAYGANARLEIVFNKHLGNPEVTQT